MKKYLIWNLVILLCTQPIFAGTHVNNDSHQDVSHDGIDVHISENANLSVSVSDSGFLGAGAQALANLVNQGVKGISAFFNSTNITATHEISTANSQASLI